MSKTIRLMYPDYVSGGMGTYYLGAKIIECILPQNMDQETVTVPIIPPGEEKYSVDDGVYGRKAVENGIKNAGKILEEKDPDKVITIGGNCMVSQAPFDYLHGKYENIGILWIDAHPDVSTPDDGYPNAHAMVLGDLLGGGDSELSSLVKNGFFNSDQVLYVGLQGLLDYQEKFLKDRGITATIQDKEFISDSDITSFIKKFDHVLVHLDIDVLDPNEISDTWFANPDLVSDGSGGGRMSLKQLAHTLKLIEDNSDIVGLTIAEYLPFSAEKMQNLFENIRIFQS